jgi:hypothetical protein
VSLIVLHIVVLLGLFGCVYQDVKERTIHVLWFAVIFVATSLINYLLTNDWIDSLYSLLFLAVNISVLFVYVSIKNKRITNIFETHLGLGDVFFFIAIIPLFSVRNFILFFITGMLVSMVLHLAFNTFQKHLTIPLAGYLSLFLISILTYSFISSNYSFLKIDLL